MASPDIAESTATKGYLVAAIAAASAVLFSGLTEAIADKKKPATTVGIQKDKMRSATKNAEAVKALLRKQPKPSTGQKAQGDSNSR